jgi:hypothetical protein
MNNHVEVCRASCGRSYGMAHLGGCFAAIIVMVVLVPAKLANLLPDGMTALRVMLWPVLAYALVFAAMLWNLGRAIKRARAIDEAALAASAVPPPLGLLTPSLPASSQRV